MEEWHEVHVVTAQSAPLEQALHMLYRTPSKTLAQAHRGQVHRHLSGLRRLVFQDTFYS